MVGSLWSWSPSPCSSGFPEASNLQVHGVGSVLYESGCALSRFSRSALRLGIVRRLKARRECLAWEQNPLGSWHSPPLSNAKQIGRMEGIGFQRTVRRSTITEAADDEDISTLGLHSATFHEDAAYMRMAVQMARKGIGRTSPNPMVGCVIVKDGQIVGRGFHPKAGEPHAEVFALREAGEKAAGATAYVSLEPCNHTGRTPPCSHALVRARVNRVVVGSVDPNPLVGGNGIKTLQNAGIEVVVGVEEALCNEVAETFFHRIKMKKPFVTLRYSMSLDGAFLGTCDGDTEAGSKYSFLLEEHDAVLITTSCLHDNPSLLSSETGAKQPLRVVLATSLDLPLESQVFDTSLAPTLLLVAGSTLQGDTESTSREPGGNSVESQLKLKGVDVVPVSDFNLEFILNLLYQKGFNSVLLDSRGVEFCEQSNFLGQLAMAEQAVQKLIVSIIPVLAGDKKRSIGLSLQDELLKLERVSSRMDKGNVCIEGYFPGSQHA